MTGWERIQILSGVTAALVVAGFGWWFGGLVIAPEYPERRGYAVEGAPPVELAALQRSWPGGGAPGQRDQLRGYIARIDQAVVPEPAGGIAAGAALPPPDLGTLLAAADAARGEKTAAVCASCHTFDQGGANRTGPNLFAVVGRAIGTHAGFAYSDAMRSHGGGWSYEELDRYLTSPARDIPGNKMAFAGIRNPRDRANVIAYLATVTPGAPPFPAPQPAAETPPAEAAPQTAAMASASAAAAP